MCAPIAPYESSRRHVRRLIEQYGGFFSLSTLFLYANLFFCAGFVEVYVSTPLTVCEARDKKGLYAKARSGQLKHFTGMREQFLVSPFNIVLGIDDPYEPPTDAEINIDASVVPVRDAVNLILGYLREQGFLPPIL